MPENRDPIEALSKVIVDQAWLLCFDEFHVTDIADAMILGRLFEALFENGVVIVATSNRPPRDLYKDGLQRERFLPFIDIFIEKMEVIELDATAPTTAWSGCKPWTSTSRPPAPRPRQQAGKRLRRPDRGPAGGRALRSTSTAATCTCRARRKALPSRAFANSAPGRSGPAIISPSPKFHTLVLDDIPRMGPAKRDQAKRFVTLIDALYDAKVKLVCSAEAGPTELYTEGDGAFEFERTVSRLIEMQSPEYMALPHRG